MVPASALAAPSAAYVDVPRRRDRKVLSLALQEGLQLSFRAETSGARVIHQVVRIEL